MNSKILGFIKDNPDTWENTRNYGFVQEIRRA